MKILFIEPRGVHSNVFEKFMTIPLLGPVYLGTIASNAGHDVTIINENILGRDVRMDELNADILCISCLTTTINRGKSIATTFKSLNPNGKTIIGGIHASMMPEDVVNYFDQVVVGEAEDVILDILNGIRKEKIIRCQMPMNLDSYPLPDFSLIKNNEKIKIIPSMASRGCPYDCNFCSVTEMFGKKYRGQSVDRVIEEISRYKGKHIFFSDDHFAANIKRTEEILNRMKRLNITFGAQVRTEVTKNEKFIAKMKDAGCSTAYIGFESINPKTLLDLNKGQKVEDIKRSIKVFKNHGIKLHGMFMLGGDTDTKKTFQATSNFCNDQEIDFVQFAILTPLPGTKTYYKLEKEKRLLHKNWEYYDGLHAVFKPKNMSAQELQQGMIDCFSDFYNYTNAFNDSLNAFVDYGIVLAKRLCQNIHFPSISPILIKWKGKEILNSWIEQNKPYLDYLKNLNYNFR